MKALRTPDDRFADLDGWPYAPHYVDVANGLRMHYLNEGPRDAPVVLLTHGEPTWSYLYRKMIPGLLDAGYRVVAPDLIGFGRSDKPTGPGDYSYRAHVDWFGAFLDAVAPDAILMFCQDWGGQIGLVDAARHPDRYRGVIAANTGVLPGFDLDLPQDHPFNDWCRYAETLDPFLPSRVVGDADSPLNPIGYELTPADVRAYDAPYPTEAHCAGARAFPGLNVMRGEQAGADICMDTWQRLASFDKPLLVVLGEHEPSFDALAPLLQTAIPGAVGQAHTTLPDAGHYLQEHAPDALVELILDFDKTIQSAA